MTRQDYLEKFWTPYPPASAETSEHGRFLGFASDSRLWLWRQDERKEVSFQKNSVSDLVIPGDLIALNAQGEIQLVAPWTTDGVFQPLNSKGLRLLQKVQGGIRRFFENQGFIEVMTPALVACPGTEPSLEVFKTELVDGSRRETRFLPTSPELHLKKALSGGLEKIFEIKTCFRNGEITEVHQPEFLMLEWYRAWETLSAIENDLVALIESLQQELSLSHALKVRRVTMRDLFREYLGMEIRPDCSRMDYAAMAEKQGLRVTETDSIDDLFFQLFSEKIEVHFEPDTLTIVHDWPPFQAALARVNSQGWAERFELYWRGLEIANAFHELNDPDLQMKRFQEDLAKKEAMGRSPISLDPEFEKALRRGLPPSAGIALGVERLTMALTGLSQINELRAFPEKRPTR